MEGKKNSERVREREEREREEKEGLEGETEINVSK